MGNGRKDENKKAEFFGCELWNGDLFGIQFSEIAILFDFYVKINSFYHTPFYELGRVIA